ncbi:MAG: pantetheine-phosphate adenylyltransferase [Patescibacteria group bacterium]
MFKKAVIGGSFDHFHKGHRSFLDYSISVANFLVVGVTSDKYLRKSKDGLLENYETRVGSVSEYLKKKGKSFEIVKIEDIYGTTLDPKFDAEVIIVTSVTKNGSWEINKKRKEKGLPELEVVVHAMAKSEDGEPISSERIREGTIDREGRLFIKPEWLVTELFTNDRVIPDLKTPFGMVIKNPQKEDLQVDGEIIAVGDESAKTLKSLGVNLKISAIDFKVKRKRKFRSLSELGFDGSENLINIKNQAGSLTPELFTTAIKLLRNSTSGESVVIIDGEEDLSVLPFSLASPLGNYIFYGQPDEGIVKVLIDEEHKAKAREIVARFSTRGH